MAHGYNKLANQSQHQQRMMSELFSMLKKNMSSMNPQKQPLFRQGESYLQNLLQQSPTSSQEEYETYKAPMMREFNEDILPDIRSQFGGQDVSQSSGLNQTLAQAGQSLQEKLAALSMGLNRQREESLYGRQMQGLGQAAQYAGMPSQMMQQMMGLYMGQQPFQYVARKPTFGQSFMSNFGQTAGKGLGNLMFGSGMGGGGGGMGGGMPPFMA